jgi:hypothetical protein
MYADAGIFHVDVATADRESAAGRPPGMATGTLSGGAALVADHLAQQGWGKLADGMIIWEDDHRVTPTDGPSSGYGTPTP